MKKASMLLLVAFIAVMSAQALAIDADEVIAKNIEARGGLERLKSVNTMRMIGKSLMQGLEFPFSMTQMRPDKLRIETTVQGQTIIQAFDGKTGWYINPLSGSTEPQEMPESAVKQLKLQADMDGFLIGYKDKGYTVKYIGEEDVEGTPAYQLAVTDTADLHVDMYVDTAYFLDLKWTIKGEREGNTFEADMYFSDFKEVDGMLMAYAMEMKSGGEVVNQIAFDSISVNPEIDSTIFKMPEKKEKAKDTGKK